VRFITLLVLAFTVYFFLKTVLGLGYLYRQKRKADLRAREKLGGEMAEDPVCHTYVPKATALRRTVAGEAVYFCGPECAEAFSKRP
jgi:YHS domain-containing protein